MAKEYKSKFKGTEIDKSLSVVNPECGDRFVLKINPTTKKFALYENMNGSLVHKADFGSVITDEFVTTEVMGGLQYQDPNGYNYHIVRVSPDTSGIGSGHSAVLGNYASRTFISSNLDGIYHTYENGVQFEISGSPMSGLDAENYHFAKITTDKMGIAYDLDFRGGYSGLIGTVCRMVWKNKLGVILHENITEAEWNATDDQQVLLDHGANRLTLNDRLPFGFPLPLPLGVEVYHEWHFKKKVALPVTDEQGTLYGNKQMLYGFANCEEVEFERIASREWVQGNVPTATYGDIKTGIQTDDHGGWVLLDGRFVNALTPTQQAVCASLGVQTRLPNGAGKVALGSESKIFVGKEGGTNYITPQNLPKTSISGTTGNNNVGHTHTIDPPSTTTGTESSNHTHGASTKTSLDEKQVPFTDYGGWKTYRFSSISGTGRALPMIDNTESTSIIKNSHLGHTHVVTVGTQSSNHTHNVDISAFTSGSQSANHTHTFSASLNTGTQTKINPEHILVNMFIYLGE